VLLLSELIVNNPADINKTNNQFPPQIVEHKKTMTYNDDVGNPGPG
jgi:hypothetical protein